MYLFFDWPVALLAGADCHTLMERGERNQTKDSIVTV
jgi:hypothetical protein